MKPPPPLLEACGCRVIEAMNGKEAVDLAMRARPDMILLDPKTPLMDGFEAARRIRKEPGLSKVPTVAYMAHYSYSLTDGALGAGFDEYIVKPATFEDMRKLVRRYLPGAKADG